MAKTSLTPYATINFCEMPPGTSDPSHDGRFGFSVSGAGNVNGGLYDDLIIGAEGEARAYIFTFESWDFGDAPDPTYPVLTGSNGARHLLDGLTYLGTAADHDSIGYQHPYAMGDDFDDLDDEDGVSFNAPIIPGQPTSVDVVASSDGFLNTWVDFNVDGDWDDPVEQVFTDLFLTAGLNASLVFPVPPAASTDPTFARFRFTSGSGQATTPSGLAVDGEVEDYRVSEMDFGDAPDTPYPTLISSNAARHFTVLGFCLGDTLDGEADGQPDLTATGDDNNGLDDEDGIIIPQMAPNMTITATAAVKNPMERDAYINAWIDFDGDGTWSSSEQIATDKVAPPGNNSVYIAFNVPPAALDTTTFARFRLSTQHGLMPTGWAPDGEVEDYAVSILMSLSGELEGSVLTLQWTEVPTATSYWIYGNSRDSYFEPGFAPGYNYRLDIVPAGTTTWSTSAGIGDPNLNWVYLVVAVDRLGQEIIRSIRVGEYDVETEIP